MSKYVQLLDSDGTPVYPITPRYSYGESQSGDALSAMPVGYVYISFDSTSPAGLFGGTWESLGGRVLLAADDTYPVESTGGAASVSLTAEQNGPHSHTVGAWGQVGGYGQINATATSNANMANFVMATQSSGNGEPHENMPPYIAVYMWRRIA